MRRLAVALILAVCAYAQEASTQIRVEVRDPSGAAVEASGQLQNLASGVRRSFETDAQGSATLDAVPSGHYRLDISKAGFATQSLVIDVESPEPLARTITLALGPEVTNVDVIATTPLPGVDLALNQIAAPVQTANATDMERTNALNLADFVNRRLDGAYLNEVQGNPFQADLNYRGYTASPLLGTPQGLSVYMDGVRLNQPFGDVVSWDLIPRAAIADMTLMPGSNPLFGLNTLGGALSVRSKDGRANTGTTLQLAGGSYGRRMGELEHGGSRGRLDWYTAANLFFEDGWRANSPSNVRQFFGRLGWQQTRTTLGLTVSYANNQLNGNGLQDQRLLARDYASVYTRPDVTGNRSPSFNFMARHSLSNVITVSGNAYFRYIRTNSFNGDINEESLGESLYQPNAAERAALSAAGYTGFPLSGENASNTPFPRWRCMGQALLQDEPGEKCNGLINRTRSEQYNYGLSGQLTWFTSPGSSHNQFTAGGAWDSSRVNFYQSTELGYLNPDRSVTGVAVYADGVTGGGIDGEPFDTRVNLRGRPRTRSVFATDTFSVGRAWNFTASGRYNRTVVNNFDRILPAAGPGSLTGRHVFDRFNPAAGVTFNPTGLVNLYFGYSEGSRAPTSIELGCADPEQPCKLPNAMAGDPPLNQVVTRTLEAGVRSSGNTETRVNWSLGWFRADNRKDILFVASQQTGFGYFKNFGKTLRQGLQVDLNARVWRATLGGGYTFLDATYQSPETVGGESNSSNDAESPGLEGVIQIQPGARIPLIPAHMLKAYADLQATSKLAVNLGMMAFASSYARGNENNQHQADGTYYLGSGRSPGYAVVNLGARYQVHPRLQLFVQINNLLDRQYYSAAQLGPSGFNNAGSFNARPFPSVDGDFPVQHSTFYAPGAPRLVWGGVRLRF